MRRQQRVHIRNQTETSPEGRRASAAGSHFWGEGAQIWRMGTFSDPSERRQNDVEEACPPGCISLFVYVQMSITEDSGIYDPLNQNKGSLQICDDVRQHQVNLHRGGGGA